MSETMRADRSIEAFEECLAKHGSDRTRWPVNLRLTFAGFPESHPEAARLMAEAEALDALLTLAPKPAAPDRALRNRILDEAFGPSVETPDGAVPMVRPQPTQASPAKTPTASPSMHQTRRSDWPAQALLAASLILGTVLGVSGALTPAIQTAMTASLEDDQQASGWSSSADSMISEDLL